VIVEEGARAFDAERYLRGLTTAPGVYRLLDAAGRVLYVGKARNLKKRVASYFTRSHEHSLRIQSMVAQIQGVEITITPTENEALLLESNLIKELKPRYNIVLRDDKSYPYIFLATDDPYPALHLHRGPRTAKGRYFGPYPAATAVRATLNLMQKLFRIRNCADSIFKSRTRPCLQYQINRCTAPCVYAEASAAYAEDVRHAVLCLEGRSFEAVESLVARMEAAAERLDFEQAARDRDRITSLRQMRQSEFASLDTGDVDIVVVAIQAGVGCVQVFAIRGGLNLGEKSFFPRHPRDAEGSEILAAFLPQYYLLGEREPPARVLVNLDLPESAWLQAALTELRGRRVTISRPARGPQAQFVMQAERNTEYRLAERLTQGADQARRVRALIEALRLPEGLERIECFDISHTQGEAAVASCVVFGVEGALKSAYRHFNIDGIAPGDDYAAMQQAITRRYTRLLKEGEPLPGLLLVDGGRGQVNAALAALKTVDCDAMRVVGVAKGPGRKPGDEVLILALAQEVLRLAADSPALHLIQQIRDEAHRFAVRAHRKRRAKARGRSALEGIPGVGAVLRKRLLQYFGGADGVAAATVEDLCKVPGFSVALAQRIHDRFHAG
jgi:excinuclease ABC subunit C